MSEIKDDIWSRLKTGPEQQNVVGPLVEQLVSLGWSLDQIMFGNHEWKIPKNPSEASKREKGSSFDFFVVNKLFQKFRRHYGFARSGRSFENNFFLTTLS